MSVKAVREPATGIPAETFHALEEKVYRTIELLKSARVARAAAERDIARVREQMELKQDEIGSLRSQMVALRREREEVRTRIEKMLAQIEALTADESAG